MCVKLISVSGPPLSGKTSIILNVVKNLKLEGMKVGIINFDCLTLYENGIYTKSVLPIKEELYCNLCPDHFFLSNIDNCILWGVKNEVDFLISESAGLCNNCSPYIKDVLSVSVIDCFSGIYKLRKVIPMLKLADIVVITKCDKVTKSEVKSFANNIKVFNRRALIIIANGKTGKGTFDLMVNFKKTLNIKNVNENRFNFSMSAVLCSYNLGENAKGKETENDKPFDLKDLI
jgi:Ni2+-binding GTPase involved in maturation of urease and hydrogenase